MKLREWLLWASVVVGAIAGAAVLGAWWLQWKGGTDLWGMTQSWLYTNANVLFLAAIWFKLGAFWHKGEGK